MLVLSRQIGEEVVLSVGGKEIGRIMVVEVSRARVRLGFTMRGDVVVDRLEVHQVKQLNAKERGHAEGEQVKQAEAKCGSCGSSHKPCLCAT